MIPTVLSTVPVRVPALTLSLLPSSCNQRMYMVSVLPPRSSGGSQATVMLVSVVEVMTKFLGSDGGPAFVNASINSLTVTIVSTQLILFYVRVHA